MYNVHSIQILCEAELADNLDVENVATLLLIAELHGCMSLGERCKKYIRIYYNAVSKTEDFQQLSASVLREINSLPI